MSQENRVLFRETLPKKGLLYTENQPQLVMCKPKLLPLKSFTLQKLEQMQLEAKEKSQEAKDDPESPTGSSGEVFSNEASENQQIVSESVSFE